MKHLNVRIIKNKLGLLNRVAELGNVPKACKVMGFSELPPKFRLPGGEV